MRMHAWRKIRAHGARYARSSEVQMNLEDRRNAVAARMKEQGVELLFGFHDNGHFIEKPNPVMLLSGFKSIGNAMVAVHADGECKLMVEPAWDAERAQEKVPGAAGTDDLVAGLSRILERRKLPPERIAVAGLGAMSAAFETAVRHAIGGEPKVFDTVVLRECRRKTGEEIRKARKAAGIAEATQEYMLRIVKPGMAEDELAAELKWYTRSLGCEDNFYMMTSGKHSMAVQTPCGRILEKGDLVLGELTPSYEGQMAQICRTLSIGPASEVVKEKYALLVHAMKKGIEQAKPGKRMAEVCNAINAVLEAEGYGQYCHPPHIRRRGHGLGFGSGLPGDVAPDNDIVLEEDMFFVIHPNQYLPETGYMMCGEPTLITRTGAELLTRNMARLHEVPV
jgi:Xaa-Pro aminopeptidase